MTVRPLATNEQAGRGFTHIAVITADDLTTTTANTAQTLTICDLKANDIIGKVETYLKTPFKDASDTAFNTSTMSVGDNSAVNTHIAAAEKNENGTEVIQGFSNTAVAYSAANTLKVTFNAMAAKSLSNIDVGEIEILFQLIRAKDLVDSVGGSAITTK